MPIAASVAAAAAVVVSFADDERRCSSGGLPQTNRSERTRRHLRTISLGAAHSEPNCALAGGQRRETLPFFASSPLGCAVLRF